MRVMQLTNSSFWKMLSTCNITTSTKPTKRDNLSFLRCVIFPFWAKDPQLECWLKLQPIYTALALYSHENLFLGKLRDSPKKEILRLTKKERLRIDGLLRLYIYSNILRLYIYSNISNARTPMSSCASSALDWHLRTRVTPESIRHLPGPLPPNVKPLGFHARAAVWPYNVQMRGACLLWVPGMANSRMGTVSGIRCICYAGSQRACSQRAPKSCNWSMDLVAWWAAIQRIPSGTGTGVALC